MKKILYGIIIILGITTGVNIASRIHLPAKSTSPVVLPAHTSATQATPTPYPYAKPQTLVIPKLGISAAVEQVGLDSQGGMDVPKGVMNVGWYSLGVMPGEVGNSVVAGHLDDIDGKPAIFYHLSDLKQGDTIQTIDDQNKTLSFTVIATASYDTNNFPLEKVFGGTSKKMLNLITCNGVFDRSIHLYSKRLVVYSELQ